MVVRPTASRDPTSAQVSRLIGPCTGVCVLCMWSTVAESLAAHKARLRILQLPGYSGEP
jgi:hypothetical protein